MNKSFHVQKTVHIARAPAVVWRVLTQPEHVKQYLYGAGLVTDWKVGSPPSR